MKFVVESVSKCSGRLGLLTNIERLPDRTYRTPLLLFVNPNLSREVLELSNFNLKEDFAIALPISNVEQMENPLRHFKKGIAEFVGLKECLVFLTLRNGSEFTASGHHEKGSVPVFRRAGKINITPARLMSIVQEAKPDAYFPLADGDTWRDCSKKRATKACERTQEFFDSCLEFHNKFDQNAGSRLIAAVEGGFNEFERKKCIEHLKEKEQHIDGYFLDGFHRGGHEATEVDLQTLKDLISKDLSLLPEDKMKLMSGSYLPHVALHLVSLGIDIFDTSFISTVTSMNRALVFNFDLSSGIKRFPEIDLADEKYKEDFTAFVDTCDCLACVKHTKAYTTHLLATHELLGPMLLAIHNLHHYKRFFETIRECIRTDRLQQLIDLVTDQYADADSLAYQLSEKTEKPIKKHQTVSE